MAPRPGLLLVTFVLLTVPLLMPAQESGARATAFALGDRAGVAFQGGLAEMDPGVLSGPRPTTVYVADGAEPTILVDKLGRGMLIGDERGVLRSTNGGQTWVRVFIPWIPGNVFGSGIFDGWALAQDDAGTIYASTTNGAIINVARSQDGGATWQLTASTFVVEGSPRIADRPWLVARGNGQVAMTWNDGGWEQRCAYSTDGGLTFPTRSVPVLAAAEPIGGIPAFMSTGHLVFAGNGGIGGAADTLYRYSAPCANAPLALAIPPHGDQLMTAVATDADRGIYLATPRPGNGAMQLIGFNGFTLNGHKILEVSPPALQGNTYGTVATRPGEIAVAWYGTTTAGNFQNPGFAGQWHVYVARVTDFWSASPSVHLTQVTTVPNHVGDFCMQGTRCDVGGNGDRDLLDYFQITYDAAGDLHVAYGHDGATSIAQVHYARLPALP
ncbi:MAG TPA: hypothetical protein VM582_07430 [Candidatus Thermoplasmatota archaeon]|nr:hypothetical protein [Candidatus Thermoplasmatota archaeon]